MPSSRLTPLVLGVILCLSGQASAGPEGGLCLDSLQHLGRDELQALFERSSMGTMPVGNARGRLLLMTTERCPRTRTWFSNQMWLGKEFHEDGYFINHWVGGLKCLHSHYFVGESWIDRQPAIVLEYPKGTPLFGNSRDEVREIAPGLYMGPLYERCPCPVLRGFIAFQIECK